MPLPTPTQNHPWCDDAFMRRRLKQLDELNYDLNSGHAIAHQPGGATHVVNETHSWLVDGLREANSWIRLAAPFAAGVVVTLFLLGL